MRIKLKKLKFPKVIYVVKENEGKDDEFFLAEVTVDQIEVINTNRYIGVYEFKQVKQIVNKTEVVE